MAEQLTNDQYQQQTGGSVQTGNPQTIPQSNLQPQSTQLQQSDTATLGADFLNRQPNLPLKVVTLSESKDSQTGSAVVVSSQPNNMLVAYGFIGFAVAIFIVSLATGLFRDKPYKKPLK